MTEKNLTLFMAGDDIGLQSSCYLKPGSGPAFQSILISEVSVEYSHGKLCIFSTCVELINQLYPDNGYTYKPALQTVEWLRLYFLAAPSMHTHPLPSMCSQAHIHKGNSKKNGRHL